MAGKSKSWYLTVADLKTHKTVFTKVFYNIADLKTYVAEPEFIEKYPTTEFYVVRETY